MLEGFDARVWITRLLTDLSRLKSKKVKKNLKKVKLSEQYLQVDSLLCNSLDCLKVHAVRQHQLLVHCPVRVEDDHHVGQRVVALLLWKRQNRI